MPGKPELRTYKRTVLFESELFEVVSCEWKRGDVSPMHSHGWSNCAILVVEGEFKNTTVLGFKHEQEIKSQGQTYYTPLGAKHEILCVSEQGKTIHVYTPRINPEIPKPHLQSTTSKAIRSNIELSLGKASNWDHLIQTLKDIESNSVTTSSPQFMNQLFSGILPQTLAAEQVISRTRTTMATFEASPVYSVIEQEVVQNLARVVGWSAKDSDGITVSGGSAANFMALHLARHKKWPQIKEAGFSNQRPRIYVSADSHYSFSKAAVALGFGTKSVVEVAVDEQGRMRPEDCRKKIETDLAAGYHPMFIGATAGTTVYGSFDPLTELSKIGKDFGIWVHIDAAWGAPAFFSKKMSQVVSGAQNCDSITFDAHKFYGANLTCSFLVAKDGRILFESNDVRGGEYLFHENGEFDRGRLSWQCGRGADVLSFWSIWKNLGDEGMGEALDKMLSLKNDLVTWIIDQPRLKLVRNPEFLNVCVEVVPPDGRVDTSWSIKVRESLRQENQALVNYYTDSTGKSFLRLILVHPELDLENLKVMLTQALAVSR